MLSLQSRCMRSTWNLCMYKATQELGVWLQSFTHRKAHSARQTYFQVLRLPHYIMNPLRTYNTIPVRLMHMQASPAVNIGPDSPDQVSDGPDPTSPHRNMFMRQILQQASMSVAAMHFSHPLDNLVPHSTLGCCSRLTGSQSTGARDLQWLWHLCQGELVHMYLCLCFSRDLHGGLKHLAVTVAEEGELHPQNHLAWVGLHKMPNF